MDIIINTDITLFALISAILGFYYKEIRPQFNSWFDTYANDPKHAWSRNQNNQNIELNPRVK